MTFFLQIILKRTSTEAHVYMRRHQGAKVKHFDFNNVIYHKFSHDAVSYTLNGENINVMLELCLMPDIGYWITVQTKISFHITLPFATIVFFIFFYLFIYLFIFFF